MNSIFKIKIKSTNKDLLGLYSIFIQKVLNTFNIKYSRINLKKKKIYTLLKSPHVYKKAREQFEIKTYKQVIDIYFNIKPTHLKFLILNKPKAIKLAIKKN